MYPYNERLNARPLCGDDQSAVEDVRCVEEIANEHDGPGELQQDEVRNDGRLGGFVG
jgi:hypothetical protein